MWLAATLKPFYPNSKAIKHMYRKKSLLEKENCENIHTIQAKADALLIWLICISAEKQLINRVRLFYLAYKAGV